MPKAATDKRSTQAQASPDKKGAQQSALSITINLADEGRLQAMRVILRYEAGVRGLSIGQFMSLIIEEAIARNRYPQELMDEIQKLRDERRSTVTRRCVAAAQAS